MAALNLAPLSHSEQLYDVLSKNSGDSFQNLLYYLDIFLDGITMLRKGILFIDSKVVVNIYSINRVRGKKLKLEEFSQD